MNRTKNKKVQTGHSFLGENMISSANIFSAKRNFFNCYIEVKVLEQRTRMIISQWLDQTTPTEQYLRVISSCRGVSQSQLSQITLQLKRLSPFQIVKSLIRSIISRMVDERFKQVLVSLENFNLVFLILVQKSQKHEYKSFSNILFSACQSR